MARFDPSRPDFARYGLTVGRWTPTLMARPVLLANTAIDRAKQIGYEASIFDSQDDRAKEAANFENTLGSNPRRIGARDFNHGLPAP